jgi:metal-responsive CopG/Arc/MetJ family transcriptional regulator
MTFGIEWMHTMKTAISVDDELLREADVTARQMGLSRSRLFSIALERYLKDRRREEITAQLNRIHATRPDAGERRKLAAMKSLFRATIRDSW